MEHYRAVCVFIRRALPVFFCAPVLVPAVAVVLLLLLDASLPVPAVTTGGATTARGLIRSESGGVGSRKDALHIM